MVNRRASGIQVSMLLHPDDTGQQDIDPAAKAHNLKSALCSACMRRYTKT